MDLLLKVVNGGISPCMHLSIRHAEMCSKKGFCTFFCTIQDEAKQHQIYFLSEEKHLTYAF